jgi:hypothetical protein
MPSKTISLALTVGVAIAAAALPAETNSAAAAERDYRAQGPGTGLYDYAGPGGIYGPGSAVPYIYVPGHGILGAPCGLPTSACPNSQRPVD